MHKQPVALITGAYRGIGLETARQLGELQYTVVISARDIEKAETAVAELKKKGTDAYALKLDVTSANDIANLPKYLTDTFGQLDVLINNAGIIVDRSVPIAKTDMELWRSTFDANLFGLVAVTNAVLPLIKKSSAGRIVNLSSNLASFAALSDPSYGIQDVIAPAYIASKAAVNAFTLSLTLELRPYNIKVNAAHPGWVKTAMGGNEAPMNVSEGAATSVWLATLPDNGPNGQFFHLAKRHPW